jgi:hypothetical protein
MLIFFCAGKISDMADQSTGAMGNAREEKLDTSYDTDDDGPDARQRRRERREALKLALKRAAEQQKGEEDDEALLDESDTDDQERPMDQGEQPAPTADPVPPGTDPTANPTPDPAAGATDAGTAEAAAGDTQDTGIVTDTGNKQPDHDDKQNKFKKPIVELNFVNCGSSAHQFGAKPAQRKSGEP